MRHENHCRNAPAGFTLIEMLTTMSVLAVLLAVAAPGLASLTTANSLVATQSQLSAALMLARSEAIKRGVQVGVAAIAPVSGVEFNGGWVVFLDANGNGQYDAGETVVRQQAALSHDVRVSTASGATALAFTPRGFLASSTMVDISVCRSSGGGSTPTKGYRLTVEPVGLADVAEITTCP